MRLKIWLGATLLIAAYGQNRQLPVEEPPIGLQFVKIPAGAFMMGCSPGDDQCSADEQPAHRVRITKPFELGKYEVTQAQYLVVTGKSLNSIKVEGLPVDLVSWSDVQGFLSKLNDRHDGYRYRLPTEAEWEYAARAGTNAVTAGKLEGVAWYDRNARSQTHSVGQKEPNAWGLHDMYGNVFEWVQDWYGDDYYAASPEADPAGPATGQRRVLRGGSWIYSAEYLRVSVRFFNVPTLKYNDLGFRCAREPATAP